MKLNTLSVLEEIDNEELSKTEEDRKLIQSIQDLNDIQTNLLDEKTITLNQFKHSIILI